MSGERSNPSTPALPGQSKSSMLAPIRTPDTSWPLGGNDHEKTGARPARFSEIGRGKRRRRGQRDDDRNARRRASRTDQPRRATATTEPAGYSFLNLEEAAFVEALVDHMVPADELTPKGTDIGINIYIDRALAGAWGKGDRLYNQGPWKLGVPSQGYQLPLTPAQLYRAGIAATNVHLPKDLRQAVRPAR